MKSIIFFFLSTNFTIHASAFGAVDTLVVKDSKKCKRSEERRL